MFYVRFYEAVAQQPVFAFTPIRGFPISQQDKFTIAMVSHFLSGPEGVAY